MANDQGKDASSDSCSSAWPSDLTTPSRFECAFNKESSAQWHLVKDQTGVLMNNQTTQKTDVVAKDLGEGANSNSFSFASRLPFSTTLSTIGCVNNRGYPDPWYQIGEQTRMPMSNLDVQLTDTMPNDQGDRASSNSFSFLSRPPDLNTPSTLNWASNEECPDQWYQVGEQTRMPMSNLDVQLTDTMPNDQGDRASSNSFSLLSRPPDLNTPSTLNWASNEECPDQWYQVGEQTRMPMSNLDVQLTDTMPNDQGDRDSSNSFSFLSRPPDLNTPSTLNWASNEECPDQWYQVGEQTRMPMSNLDVQLTDTMPNDQGDRASSNSFSFLSRPPDLNTPSTLNWASNEECPDQWYQVGEQTRMPMSNLDVQLTDTMPNDQGDRASSNSFSLLSRPPDLNTPSTLNWASNEECPDQWYQVGEQTRMPMSNLDVQLTDTMPNDQGDRDSSNSFSFLSRPPDLNTPSTLNWASNEECPDQWYQVGEQTRMPMSNLAAQKTDTMPNDQSKEASSNSLRFAPWPSNLNISSPFGCRVNKEDLDLIPCSLNSTAQELGQFQERKGVTAYMTADNDQARSMTHHASFKNMIQRSELFPEKSISDFDDTMKINHNRNSCEQNELSSDWRIHERYHLATPELSSTLDTVQIISPSLPHHPIKNISGGQHEKGADLKNRLPEYNLENMPAHGTAARFICSTCDQGFKYNNSFRAHLKSHQCKLPLSCDKCQTQFTRPDTLKRHNRKFHGDAIFKCDQCAIQFQRLRNLNDHNAAVHDGVQFQCDKCPNKYTRKSSLKRHYMIVHEGFQLTCEKCLRQFTCERNFKRHRDYCHRAD